MLRNFLVLFNLFQNIVNKHIYYLYQTYFPLHDDSSSSWTSIFSSNNVEWLMNTNLYINFSSFNHSLAWRCSLYLCTWKMQDSEAYACLLNVLAPECSAKPSAMSVKDLLHRARLILEHADRMGCKRYLTPKDIVDGLPNLNLAFVAHIFQKRYVCIDVLHRSIWCLKTVVSMWYLLQAAYHSII